MVNLLIAFAALALSATAHLCIRRFRSRRESPVRVPAARRSAPTSTASSAPTRRLDDQFYIWPQSPWFW